MLVEAVELYKDCKVGMWKKVAHYVSSRIPQSSSDAENGKCVVTNHQCGERYKHHLHPDIQSKKTGPWTDEEVYLNLIETASSSSH